jgi:hypothetical protein
MSDTFCPGQRIYTETRTVGKKRHSAHVVRLHGTYISEDETDRARVVVRLDTFDQDTTPLRSIVFAAEDGGTP